MKKPLGLNELKQIGPFNLSLNINVFPVHSIQLARERSSLISSDHLTVAHCLSSATRHQ